MGLEIGPSPHAAVYDVWQTFTVRHLNGENKNMGERRSIVFRRAHVRGRSRGGGGGGGGGVDDKTRTCNRPSRLLGMVTHLLGCPGQLRAFSSSSMAPLVFFSFLTSASTAFSAHFSSSSPCFHPNSFFTAGLVNENRLFIDEMVDDERPESNSSTSMAPPDG